MLDWFLLSCPACARCRRRPALPGSDAAGLCAACWGRPALLDFAAHTFTLDTASLPAVQPWPAVRS